MTTLWNWLSELKLSFIVLEAVSIVIVAWLFRLGQRARLIVRLMMHEDRGDSRCVVRLLIHNAEPIREIGGLRVRFGYPNGAHFDGAKTIKVAAGPNFEGSAESVAVGQVRCLELVTSRCLRPGRSWLFSFDFPATPQVTVWCDLSAQGLSSGSVKRLEVSRRDNKLAVNAVDLLPFGMYPVVTWLAAFAIAGVPMFFAISSFSEPEDVWMNVGILGIITVIFAMVLQLVLRPNKPHVALGYGGSQEIEVRRHAASGTAA